MNFFFRFFIFFVEKNVEVYFYFFLYKKERQHGRRSFGILNEKKIGKMMEKKKDSMNSSIYNGQLIL